MIRKNLVMHVISVVDIKLDGIYRRIKVEYEKIDIDELYNSAKTIIA